MSEVTIKWLGHAHFLISNNKVKIALDPFDSSVGYPMPDVSADILLMSHGHLDHNNASAVKGNPVQITGYGKKSAKGIDFTGVKTYHDDQQGKSGRGENTVFVWEMEGIRFAHCGDLGHLLTEQNLKEIGAVDVVMIPVGGFYTIDSKVATQNIEKLKPKVVIPMHYKQPFMGDDFPIDKVDVFLQGKKNVQKVGKNTLTLNKEKLPEETTIFVLEYK
ncbi:MAG: beta-lactamase fold-like protein Zn-dependent hydrolase [candidate division Zixibacteria bacterium RBG-1]|nr:MAG: beta-lactamase fold-like protein Zn-dependent hydrolase [candidate division Zixibacteria bacterium RBG-1]